MKIPFYNGERAENWYATHGWFRPETDPVEHRETRPLNGLDLAHETTEDYVEAYIRFLPR